MTEIIKFLGGKKVVDEQDIQNAAADKASYYFDASGTNIIQTPVSANLALGDSDCTFIIQGKFKQSSANEQYIRYFVSGSYFLILEKNTDNTIRLRDPSGNVSTTITVDNDKVQTLIGQRVGNTVNIYKNGALILSTAMTKLNLIGSPYVLIGEGSNSIKDESVYRAMIFNYALSADKIARYSAGAKLDYEDVGGSMTNIIPISVWYDIGSSFESSSFSSADRTTFQGNNTTATGGAFQTIDLIEGKQYQLTCTTNFNGTVNLEGYNSGTYAGQYTTGVAVSGTPLKLVFTANIATANRLVLFAGVTGSPVIFSNISLIQLGAVLDLEPENITDALWVDASPNGLHGTVTGALAQRFTPSYDTRNYIINGGFDFNQRGIADSADLVNNAYFYDRFRVIHTGLSGTARVASSLGNSIQIYNVATPASGKLGVEQIIENPKFLANKNVTLSVLCKTNYYGGSSGGGVYLSINDGINPTVYSKVPQSTNTYQWLTLTTKLGNITTENLSIKIELCGAEGTNISFANGTDQNLYVSRVMLNEGSVAAPFQRAGGSIGGELTLCQRYYEKSYKVTVVPGTSSTDGSSSINGYTSVSGYKTLSTRYQVRKRVSNSIPILYDFNGNKNYISTLDSGQNLTNQVIATPTAYTDSEFDVRLISSNVTGLVYHWTVESEL